MAIPGVVRHFSLERSLGKLHCDPPGMPFVGTLWLDGHANQFPNARNPKLAKL
jgi:hypothetical protein